MSLHTMTDQDLGELRANTIQALAADGLFPNTVAHSCDPRSEVIHDIDRILQRRNNQRDAAALMQHPEWSKTWPATVKRIAHEMLDACDEHCGNARGALRRVAYDEPHEHPRSVKETSDAWNDRYDVLRYVCDAAALDNTDPVIVALRRVFKDREEPLYGWTNKAEIGEPPVPADPAEKKRADDRLERYFQVWDDLSVVVRGRPARNR